MMTTYRVTEIVRGGVFGVPATVRPWNMGAPYWLGTLGSLRVEVGDEVEIEGNPDSLAASGEELQEAEGR